MNWRACGCLLDMNFVYSKLDFVNFFYLAKDSASFFLFICGGLVLISIPGLAYLDFGLVLRICGNVV